MPDRSITRRMFAVTGGLALSIMTPKLRAQSLQARPGGAPSSSVSPGLHQLMLREERDALLYIPESAGKWDAPPLVVSLHGATRNADRGIDVLRAQADQHGFLLLAPASIGTTWDVIEGGSWGPDVRFIDRSLARVFELKKIDPARIAMAGFSDGASYSLSIGLCNGDLFSAVFGFSPGFIAPGPHEGKPPIFISHGTVDQVLPIDECSRRIVPQLEREGYQVTYREFEGKHELPPAVASEAMRWFMDMA